MFLFGVSPGGGPTCCFAAFLARVMRKLRFPMRRYLAIVAKPISPLRVLKGNAHELFVKPRTDALVSHSSPRQDTFQCVPVPPRSVNGQHRLIGSASFTRYKTYGFTKYIKHTKYAFFKIYNIY